MYDFFWHKSRLVIVNVSNNNLLLDTFTITNYNIDLTGQTGLKYASLSLLIEVAHYGESIAIIDNVTSTSRCQTASRVFVEPGAKKRSTVNSQY